MKITLVNFAWSTDEIVWRLRNLLIAVFIACVITSLGNTTARAESPARADGELRVLTYNVQFLPGLVSHQNERRRPLYRAAEIARRIADRDIVGLNEVFDARPREALFASVRKEWGDACHIVTGPDATDGRLMGGLAILSRYPFVETHTTIYTVASSPLEYGLRADGWVAKGALHARVSKSAGDGAAGDPLFLDAFATHLEARVDAIRHQQFGEFAAFVGKHAGEMFPVLMLGDFNTRGGRPYRVDPTSPYNKLFAALEDALPKHHVHDLWPMLNEGADGGTSEQIGESGGKRIDYIFLATPMDRPNSIRPKAVRVNRFLDDQIDALSDHSGVEAELVWPADRAAR